MSKSLGNTVSPEEMISRFGADTVRLFILFGANPEAGMDWSDSALEANHRQMFSLIDGVDTALEFSDSPSKIDDWLMSRLRANQKKWIEVMSNVSLREGVMVSHFEMLSDWNWYLRRGGCDRITAMSFLQGWIPMLAPATPHIAEEFWKKLGREDLLAKFVIPILQHDSNDIRVLALESYIKEIISSGRNLRALAERHSNNEITRVVIQTSPEWKSDLASEAISLHKAGFDFKEKGQSHVKSLAAFKDESTRGEVFQTWNTITVGGKKTRGKIHTWLEGGRTLISEGINEVEVIKENSDFIASALEVDSVEVFSVGEAEDVGGKARISFPLEPGIAFV
jgi:leucyl-tRNA synthetase